MADDGVKISALTEVLTEPATGEMVASVVGGVTYKRDIGKRLPSTTQKSALAGYGGTPSGTNPYATQTALDGKAASSHTHDDRYFTESEVTTALDGKAASSHNHDSNYANLGNYNAFHDWSSSKTYALNEPCFYQGVPYKSLVASNLNETPSSNPTSWQMTGVSTSSEPIYLSNSESTANTNGVVSKTKLGIDGTPILANTAVTYYDCTLPRSMLPNETIAIEVHSKKNNNWIDAGIAGIDSLFICNLADRIINTSHEYRSGFSISQPTAGQIRVRVSTTIRGSTVFDGGTVSDISWATMLAAADGYNAWRIHIGA